ncbi:erythromycin esterase family protein [Acidobacteria bacterium AB60]|nr:erythromycin esterase family protein [Acidobacteria bacterium AB60]
MFSRPLLPAAALLLLCSLGALRACPQQLRPGVWAGTRVDSLPFPTGYQLYIVGEQHGLQENAEFQLAYLALLVQRTPLRDIALEEKSVYESAAQSYVDGRAESLPPALCLRAALLRGLRSFNSQLAPGNHVRVHLIDVDSPASAIHEHLVLLSRRIPHARRVDLPAAAKLEAQGEEAVRRLEALTADEQIRTELRSVALAIRALQEGFEAGTGPARGSPYLEEREEAMTQNLAYLIRRIASAGVLVICGFDHASRRQRGDGGPDRNQPFWPLAARLERSGLQLFTLITFPLAGETFWRGTASTLLWEPDDGHLSSGEKLSALLSSAPAAKFLYIDAATEPVRLPSQDASDYGANAFLLFPRAHPMIDECLPPEP